MFSWVCLFLPALHVSLSLPSALCNLLNVLMLLIGCHHKRLIQSGTEVTGVCLCANVHLMCVCACVRVHHYTAHWVVGCNNCWVYSHHWLDHNSQTPSHCLPRDWPTPVIPSLQLAPNFSPSLPIGPPEGCCLVTSEAHIFEQCSGCLLQHFYRQSAEWDNLTHTHTHTHIQEHKHSHRFRGRHSMHPGDTLALLLDLLVLTLTPQSAQLG